MCVCESPVFVCVVTSSASVLFHLPQMEHTVLPDPECCTGAASCCCSVHGETMQAADN